VVQYTDGVAGVDPATLSVVVNGIDRTALFAATGTEARFQPTGLEVPPVFQEGANSIVVTLADGAGNLGLLETVFAVDTSSPPPPPPPPPLPKQRLRLVKISGDGQTGTTNLVLGEPLIWKVADADTGAAVPYALTEARICQGGGVLVDAGTSAMMTDMDGLARMLAILGPDEETIVVEVRLFEKPEAEAIVFTLRATRPIIDLVEKGPSRPDTYADCVSTVVSNCGSGRVALEEPSFDGTLAGVPPLARDARYPGDASSRLFGIRAKDANGQPIRGAHVKPSLLDFSGQDMTADGMIECLPSQALTDDSGCAFFAVRLPPGTPSACLRRIRLELTRIHAGDADKTPLGCEWVLAVLDPDLPKPNNPGCPVQVLVPGSGQGRIAVENGPGVELELRARPGTSCFIWAWFNTTQPGDALSIVEGTLYSDEQDAGMGLQTLSAYSTTGRIRVSLRPGPVPLPRVISVGSYDANESVFVLGPAESRLLRLDGADLVAAGGVTPSTDLSVDEDRHLYVEAIRPPGEGSLRVEEICALDVLQREITVVDGVAPTCIQVPLHLVEQDENRAVYKSDPAQPIVATDRLVSPGTTVSPPAGYRWIQTGSSGMLRDRTSPRYNAEVMGVVRDSILVHLKDTVYPLSVPPVDDAKEYTWMFTSHDNRLFMTTIANSNTIHVCFKDRPDIASPGAGAHSYNPFTIAIEETPANRRSLFTIRVQARRRDGSIVAIADGPKRVRVALRSKQVLKDIQATQAYLDSHFGDFMRTISEWQPPDAAKIADMKADGLDDTEISTLNTKKLCYAGECSRLGNLGTTYVKISPLNVSDPIKPLGVSRLTHGVALFSAAFSWDSPELTATVEHERMHVKYGPTFSETIFGEIYLSYFSKHFDSGRREKDAEKNSIPFEEVDVHLNTTLMDEERNLSHNHLGVNNDTDGSLPDAFIREFLDARRVIMGGLLGGTANEKAKQFLLDIYRRIPKRWDDLKVRIAKSERDLFDIDAR